MRNLAFVAAALVSCATSGKRDVVGSGGEASALRNLAEDTAISEYLDKEAVELHGIGNARRTRTGIVLDVDSSLLFASDSVLLKPSALKKLARLGDLLVEYPDDRIRIACRADSPGFDPHAERISFDRAAAVREVFAIRGISRWKMYAEVAGESGAYDQIPDGHIGIYIYVPNATRQRFSPSGL